MSTTLRVLTREGMNKFADYIGALRQGAIESPPIDQLQHGPWSIEFIPVLKVENNDFSSRQALGKCLVELFEGAHVDRNKLVLNIGLWSWLALFWFDRICPPDSEGIRKIRENARYICSSDWRDYYRHIIASSWMIYDMHRENSRLFLECPTYIHNDFIEQVASNQDVITNKPLIGVMDDLYWDGSSCRPKKNATNRNVPGNIRRLVSATHQFDLTYDIRQMSQQEIVDILGSEFAIWKSAR